MGLSIGLDTAVSALRAHQLAIDTSAHNVANADTEGYSRQQVAFRAISPAKQRYNVRGNPQQELGLGVDSGRIRRLRDVLLDTQYRDVRTARDEFMAEATALSQAEVTLNEPSDQGLQALLTRFFNGFRDLAAQPESVAARAATVEQGATLAAALNRTASMLNAQRADLDASMEVKIEEINAKAQEIADLNAQIRIISVAGGTSNDLHDRRDLLVDELSGLVGVSIETRENDVVDVYIGGRMLVDDITVNPITTRPDPGNNNLRRVVWASDDATVDVTGGELQGILRSRDTHVTGLMTRLDEMASALLTAVNGHHRTGYGLNNATGLDFFTGTTAADIKINSVLQGSPESLATSAGPNEPGNTAVARLLSGVQNEKLLGSGTTTIDDFYRTIVSRLGVSSQQASLQAENQDVLTRHLETSRQSVAGVSIDEEMTEIMKAQHGYQAAARLVSTIDNMLDTLINRTRG
jgi:flagellar hook-associated protein 1